MPPRIMVTRKGKGNCTEKHHRGEEEASISGINGREQLVLIAFDTKGRLDSEKKAT